MGTVISVIDNAAIFFHFEFIAVPIGTDAISAIFGEIVCIDPEIVVESFAILESSRRKVGVEGKRDEQARNELPPEFHVEMLFFIGRGHHITQFGIGEYGLVGCHGVLVLQHGRKRW